MSQMNNSSTKRRTSKSGSSSRKSSFDRDEASRIAAVQRARSGNRRGHNNRRRKPHYDITQILMYGIALLILIICVMLAFNSCSKSKPAATGESQAESTEEETELLKEVTVDGIVITGMTREEAKKKIMEHYSWDMKVTYSDKELSVSNLIEKKVDEVLDEIFTGEPKEIYEIDNTGLTEEIREEVASIASQWDVPAKNGGISSFDSASGKFSFSDGTPGIVIDQDKLAADIADAVSAKNYKAVLKAGAGEVAPEMTAAQARDKYQTIGTYNTTTTANKDRNENIRLATAALNGVILQPGETFSFNDATGARTVAKGYKPAGAYLNGVLVEEPGGGVCQVSSTLYNAVVFSGLKTTERHAHSFEPSYVTPGEDAMVSFGGPDMKFINNSKYPVAIKASFADRKLTISIFGVRILDDGVKLRMRSEKTGEIDPPAPEYEEDQTLEPGVEVVSKAATPGSRWVTYLVTYQGDKVDSEEFFHNSAYRGKPATIKRNTSGVVVTTPGESTESESGSLEGTETTSGDGSMAETDHSVENPGSITGPNAGTTESAPTTESEAANPNQGPGGSSVAPSATISPNPLS